MSKRKTRKDYVFSNQLFELDYTMYDREASGHHKLVPILPAVRSCVFICIHVLKRLSCVSIFLKPNFYGENVTIHGNLYVEKKS